jgi:hypothetical protein
MYLRKRSPELPKIMAVSLFAHFANRLLHRVRRKRFPGIENPDAVFPVHSPFTSSRTQYDLVLRTVKFEGVAGS